MVRYEFGTKQDVLRCLFEYAIRDQESLIDALEGNGHTLNQGTIDTIKETETLIRDFIKLRNMMLKRR